MSAEKDNHLNVRQAAEILGVHENTIRNWADKGLLPPSKILPGSGFKRFSRADVVRMREEMLNSYAPDTLMPEQKETEQ